jgi:uncharacterized protein (DUF2062 family)
MPRKFIKRLLPDHRKVRDHRHLRLFGKLLHDPNLWHLNRRSAAGAFAVGLFVAFVPIPFQMVLAAAVAILVRVNLPLSAALVWLTNPITMPPMFYFAYRVGAWLLQTPPREVTFEISAEWLATEMGAVWEPFLLGCFVCGAVSASIGYFAIRGLWRLQLVRHHRRKKDDRARRAFIQGP